MEYIDYVPVASGTIDMAIASSLDEGEVIKLKIFIKTKTSLSSPTTFITDNGLEHEVISIAGLDEEVSLSSYGLLETKTYTDHYVYVLEAAVS